MRATIKNYIEAANRRHEEEGEEGFSLIELIIVVVILGILVAIAIPVFGALQEQAEKSSLEAAAANGATSVAAAIADPAATVTVTNAVAKGSNDKITLSLVPDTITDTSKIDIVCVRATKAGTSGATAVWAQSGPGCTGASSSWTTTPAQ